MQPQQQSQTPQEYSSYGVSGVLPPHMAASDSYTVDPAQHHQILSAQQQKPRQLSQVSGSHSSHYNTPYQSPHVGYPASAQPPSQPQLTRKRSFQQQEYTYDYPSLQTPIHSHASSNGAHMTVEMTPQGHPAQPPGAVSYHYQPPRSSSAQSNSSQPVQQSFQQSQQQTQHHHHRLPNQQPPNKQQRTSFGHETPEDDDHGPPSVVGQPGMPEPAPRPKGPKLKFTPDDDALLVELKENKNLTWKQIADFFPGRSSGTLQVRYCTKLKAKATVWTDDMVQRLHAAMQEYEADRWRIISGKVGNGFSAVACKDKALEMDTTDWDDGAVGYARRNSFTTATTLVPQPPVDSTLTTRDVPPPSSSLHHEA